MCALEVREEPCEIQGAALHAGCRGCWPGHAQMSPKEKDKLLSLVSPPKAETQAWQASSVLEAAPSTLRHTTRPHVLGDSDGGQL